MQWKQWHIKKLELAKFLLCLIELSVEMHLEKLGLTRLGFDKGENEGATCLAAPTDEKWELKNPSPDSECDANTPDWDAILAPYPSQPVTYVANMKQWQLMDGKFWEFNEKKGGVFIYSVQKWRPWRSGNWTTDSWNHHLDVDED